MESKNLMVANTNKGKPMLLQKFAVCDSEKLRFIKEHETEVLLSTIPKIPIFGPLLI